MKKNLEVSNYRCRAFVKWKAMLTAIFIKLCLPPTQNLKLRRGEVGLYSHKYRIYLTNSVLSNNMFAIDESNPYSLVVLWGEKEVAANLCEASRYICNG
jgi:hypothetical protein